MWSIGRPFFFGLNLALVNLTYCLECYTCLSATDLLQCNQTTRCGQNEVCFTDRHGALYTSGCVNIQQCSHGTQAGVLVGRDMSARQSADCYECCSTDLCNGNLCVHSKPSACVDDETVDCPKMHTLFGICSDIQKAKLVCAKFCNLCSLVDGQWSEWSSWSVCSVTCENGTETRQRSCTNPAPTNGGLDCQGSATETKPCLLESCPVHGGWSMWSDWGSCSVSCDVGLQRRDRSCNNPYPARNCNHCFGDSGEDRICMPRSCADGSWSVWESWSTCSDSCGGGVKTRERSCTNPPPSLIGRPCIGTSVQSTTCNRNQCINYHIAFTAYDRQDPAGENLVFTKTLTNYGNGYDPHTGKFTCSVPGLYYFAASLTKWNGSPVDYVECYILINSIVQVGTHQNPHHLGPVNNDYDGYSISMTATFHLNKYDYVNIGKCIGQDAITTGTTASFTGFLVAPDF